MPPTSPRCGPVRSAAVVNEEIRALWLRSRGRLDPVQRAEYERLLGEYAAAVAARVVKAA